jgi:hypothetical protein
MPPLKPGDLRPAVFNWEDAFLLEEQLTGQERMLRDGARAFAEDRLQPRVLNDFAKETADPNVVFREMGEAGLFGRTRASTTVRCAARRVTRIWRQPGRPQSSERARDKREYGLDQRGRGVNLPLVSRRS